MKFDDVIKELGEFGPYQKWIYSLLCILTIPGAFHTMIGVFTLAEPPHRCHLKSLENDTFELQGQWHDALVNKSIPWDEDGDKYDECKIFTERNNTKSCNKWVYDRSTFDETIISEMDLVCGDKSLRTYANMILMGGLLGGSIILGSLSDIIGRKKVLMLGILGQFAVTVAIAFVTTYVPFVILIFLKSFFGIGISLSAFVIGMEVVGPSKRRFSGIVVDFFWCLGLFILNLLAYFIRDWKYLQLTVSIPGIVYISYYWLLPESPRWLLQKGRRSEASEIVKTAAKVNKVKLADKVSSLQEVVNEGSGEKIWHMFRDKALVIRSLVVFFNWLVASVLYYGLSLNVSELSGNIFLNFFLSALVEGAAYIFCLVLLDVTGRKFLQSFTMILSGVSCAGILFPVIFDAPDWVSIVLSLIGKFGASAGFAVIYIYSAELFPTPMRNSGMGASSFSARIGGVMAPYIADLGNIVKGDIGVALPQLIFGGLGITAGLLALLLPETRHRILPDTVEDAKNFTKKNGKNSFALKVVASEEMSGKDNPVFVDKL